MIKELMKISIEAGNMPALEAILAQYEEDLRMEREIAFNKAMVKFQGSVGHIKKNGVVDFTYNGKRTNFKYALLSDIDDAIRKPLSEAGLTKKWEFAIDERLGRIATCVISHEQGGSSRTSISTTAIDSSDGKGQLKGESSTETYLMRRTLIGALGLSSADEDNDGGQEQEQQDQCVSKEQVKTLKKAIKESAITEKEFLKAAKAETLDAILSDRFEGALNYITSKKEDSK